MAHQQSRAQRDGAASTGRPAHVGAPTSWRRPQGRRYSGRGQRARRRQRGQARLGRARPGLVERWRAGFQSVPGEKYAVRAMVCRTGAVTPRWPLAGQLDSAGVAIGISPGSRGSERVVSTRAAMQMPWSAGGCTMNTNFFVCAYVLVTPSCPGVLAYCASSAPASRSTPAYLYFSSPPR